MAGDVPRSLLARLYVGLVFVATTSLASCSGSLDEPGPNTGHDAGFAPIASTDAAAPSDVGAARDAGAVSTWRCADAIDTCAAWNVRATCTPSPDGGARVLETCAGGCFQGRCANDACTDECVLGETSARGTCVLFDLTTKAEVPAAPVTSLTDRARDYDAWLHRLSLHEGVVLDPRFTDAAHTKLEHLGGGGDASIWTGTALAAFALEAVATGAPIAQAHVRDLAATMHRAFAVSGDPGYLARLVVPTTSAEPIEEVRCSSPRWHCNAPYAGGTVHWMGDTSRDQYTGAILGEAMALLATDDDATRAAMRSDLVTLGRELMTPHDVPVHAEIDLYGVPITVDRTIRLENVVVAPSEMVGGKVVMSGDPSAQSGSMRGLREFLPDIGALVGPLTGVSASIPRAASAMMLGAFFSVAVRAARGVPEYASDYTALSSYLAQHGAEWIDVAKRWSLEAGACDDTYYPNHFAFVTAALWAMLDEDPARAQRVRDEVLDGRLQSALGKDKNVYFTFLWGAGRGLPPSTPEVRAAADLLTTFPPGPRVRTPVDARARYTATAACTAPPMSDEAVALPDRPVTDFMWQRSPRVTFDGGDPRVVFPGVDYLVAYWLGRRSGFIADDRPHTCARFL